MGAHGITVKYILSLLYVIVKYTLSLLYGKNSELTINKLFYGHSVSAWKCINVVGTACTVKVNVIVLNSAWWWY